MPPFKLSATLQGHANDVRSVHAVNDTLILSSSRDNSARAWSRPSSNSFNWSTAHLFEDAHQGYVNVVHWLHTSTQDYVITGGSDGLVNLWPYPPPPGQLPNPSRTLVGHTSNVCCIDVSASGRIVTGSWDSTARVWIDFAEAYQLPGHEMSVWAVLTFDNIPPFPNEEVTLTGCADSIIRLFKGKNPSSPSAVFKGHTQPVRALVHLPSLSEGGFASASNDGSIRIWNFKGDTLSILEDHASYIYSLTLVPTTGELVSSGEDRTARVWSDSGKLEQTITLPALSIWSASAMPCGDLAVGSSDNMLRIFTRTAERVADEETLKEFENLVSGTAINKSQLGGGLNTTDIADASALQTPGSKEGQVKMIKNGMNIEAHQWDSSTLSWQKVGDVVDSVGSSSKVTYEGAEYDYVFDVDVQEGVPPLKLPFNANQNPYEVAQKFLEKHELPSSYIDQVVEFIDKNTGGLSFGSRAADQSSNEKLVDLVTPSLLPHRTPLTFTQVNFSALLSKLKEFNSELTSSTESALDLAQVEKIESLIDSLSKNANEVKIDFEVQACFNVLFSWPESKLLPVFDLFRMICLSDTNEEVLNAALKSYSSSSFTNAKEKETNTMLLLRALSNVANTVNGKRVLSSNAAQVLAFLASFKSQNLNKNSKVAFATCYLNYSILAVERDLDRFSADPLVAITKDLLGCREPEAVYRTLVGLGNILLCPNVTAASSSQTLQSIQALAKDVASSLNEDRMKKIVAELKLA